MKIAIPTMDGVSISQHFGRCKAFLIFDVEGSAIRSKESRENGGGCGGHDAEGHAEHGHGRFARLLGDCEMVIAKGMGGGAMQALQGAGLRVKLVQENCTAEEAALRFVNGTLAESLGGACACGHH